MQIFDSEAETYDRWYETPLGKFVDSLETREIISLLHPTKGMHILDAGCGTGNYSIKLARLGCMITGVDISEKMLAVARKKAKNFGQTISFINCSIDSLPFASEQFDAAVSVVALEFVENQQKSLDELFRVVQRGSRIVVGCINRDSAWGELYQSDYFQKNTVFKYANLLDIDRIKSFHPKELVSIRESLFIPPDVNENDISLDLEEKLSKINKPGFLSVLWIKQ
jgi:ubiquinone/menaquinone biosynthesis C-methylase UbiE